ncbi:MAG: acyltransferase [Candidatus Kariarchaeaceae archaeon]
MSSEKPIKIHPTAIVEDGAKIASGTMIWHFVHIRSGSEIGSNCIFGKGAYVDTGVKIGNNVKVQNLVSIYQGVEIEDDVFVGPHVCFTNDLVPRAVNIDWQIVETLIKKGVSIGANSTIVCGTVLGEYSMIGAGSVVTKDVPPHALVFGNPAKVKGYVCFCGEKIAGPKITDQEISCIKCGKKVSLHN